MELIAFSAEGYRRFAEKTSVKLVGKLIAFVGPNEAGKSSLLAALAALHDDEPFKATDRPRRSELVPMLSWHFKLDGDDKVQLSGIHDSETIERVVITRRWQANDRWSFQPHNPLRDTTHRVPLAEQLEKLRGELVERGVEADLLDSSTELLRLDKADLTSDEVDHLDQLLAACTDASGAVSAVGDEELEDPEDRTRIDELGGQFRSTVEMTKGAVAAERARSPYQEAWTILKERLPRFCLFAGEDRDLKSEYEIPEVANLRPPALEHLVTLAGLDLVAVESAIDENRIADVSTFRNAANKRLREVFAESWNQTGVAVQLEVNGTTLLVQATTPSDDGLSTFAERSDGMRWFAALLAYSHGWEGPTVLLADEIETHLHYDAQADLLNVLQNQTFAEKVLYTTHSFGCLPPDLGAGVRVVRPVDTGRSKLENGFWAEGSGFSPLLARMGSAALSFTPARRAVIAEGPADAVLLPTLLRQAADVHRLGYQVVPGLSAVAAASIPQLSEEAGRVFFLTDSDAGGSDLRRLLDEEGVPSDRIFELAPGNECELEDLVALEPYLAAVNAEIEVWQSTDERVTADDLEGQPLRTKVLAMWCEAHSIAEPDKVAVAQRLVEMAADEEIVAPHRQGRLVALHNEWRETEPM